MKNTIRTFATLSLLATAFSQISCGDKEKTEAPAATIESSSTLDSIIVNTEPADAATAQTITEVRKAPEVGQKVIMRGKVMGRLDPFVAGRAMVMIGDDNVLTSCDLRSCGGCATPWDVCCDESDSIKLHTATIQIVDQDGQLLKQGLKGIKGLKELSQVVVIGTIAEGTNADNLLVNASSLYVSP